MPRTSGAITADAKLAGFHLGLTSMRPVRWWRECPHAVGAPARRAWLEGYRDGLVARDARRAHMHKLLKKASGNADLEVAA